MKKYLIFVVFDGCLFETDLRNINNDKFIVSEKELMVDSL